MLQEVILDGILLKDLLADVASNLAAVPGSHVNCQLTRRNKLAPAGLAYKIELLEVILQSMSFHCTSAIKMFPTIRTLNLDMAGRLMILEDVLPQFVSFLHFDHFEALDTAVGVEVSMTLIEVVVQIHLVDVALSANGARHWDFNLVFGQGAEQCFVRL